MARLRTSTGLGIAPGRVLGTIGWVAIGLGVVYLLVAGFSTPSAVAIPSALTASAPSNPSAAAVVERMQSNAPWRWLIAEIPAVGLGVALVVLGALVLKGKPAGRSGLVSLCTLCLWVLVVSLPYWVTVSLASLLGHGVRPFSALGARLALAQVQSAELVFIARAYLLSGDVTVAFKAVERP